MALSYKARRRWSLVILVLGVPLYIVACVTVLNWLDRPPFVVELGVYLALGILWALPFRAVFRGVGRADPAPAPKGPRAAALARPDAGAENRVRWTRGRDGRDGGDGGGTPGGRDFDGDDGGDGGD